MTFLIVILNWDNLLVQISHSGIDVILMDLQTDVIGNNDSLIATFTDGGADLASSAVVGGLTIGTFAPQEPLSAFNGAALSGQWTLTIYNNDVGEHDGDGTDLLSSSIFGLKTEVAPTVVPTLSLFGLIALLVGLLGVAFITLRRKT